MPRGVFFLYSVVLTNKKKDYVFAKKAEEVAKKKLGLHIYNVILFIFS